MSRRLLLSSLMIGLGGCAAGTVEKAPPRAGSRLFISPQLATETLVFHQFNSPPPWPSGNCATIYLLTPEEGEPRDHQDLGRKEAHLANMFSENFREVVKRLGLKSIEVEVIDPRTCLIVDSRIGKEWLKPEPCAECVPEESRKLCSAKYARYFGEPSPAVR